MPDSRTKQILEAYIAHMEPALKAGRIDAPMRSFDAVMEAANDPKVFTGDEEAASKLVKALTHWETQSTLSTPFPHSNLTWVPASIGGDDQAIVASLVDEEAAADLAALTRFFVPADRKIIAGWAAEAQGMHELFLTNDNPTERYCLLDSMNDCRITRYPSGKGSQPAIEIMAAAHRAKTWPDVPIAGGRESYLKVRKLGWHMDLARVEAAQILLRDSRAARHIGTGAERLLKRYKMPTIPVRSYSRLLDICHYVEQQVQSFGRGFSVWYRGQPSSYKRSRALNIAPAAWKNLLERLKKRLTYLDDDDLLLPAFYRHYGTVWQNAASVRKQFQSLAAWQFVSNQMLFDEQLFPTAPDIVLADEVPEIVLSQMENCVQENAGLYTKMSLILEPGRPGTFQELESWAYHYIIVDGQDHFIFKRTHREAQRNATSTLLLQHYGCPTSGLDITYDPERAAMFALGRFNYGKTGEISWNDKFSRESKPCIYIMLLKEDRDPFLRSTSLFKGANDDNRIVRQKCGILFGTSWACRNFAQRYIALKLELDFDLHAELDPRIVYPTMDEDPISRSIVEKFGKAYAMLDEHGGGPSEVRFPPSFVSSW